MANATVKQTTPDDTFVTETHQFHEKAVDAVRLPGDWVMGFAERVRNVACGSQALTNVSHRDDIMAQADEGPRLLSPANREDLLLLLQTSLGYLANDVGDFMEDAYFRYTKEGAAMKEKM
ncbi:MAG: hypothetical protein Q7T46_05510 [Polaromonas sp.]|nr:hypothetical protein [Polaromonas sp.]